MLPTRLVILKPGELLRAGPLRIEAVRNLRERVYSQTKSLIVTGAVGEGELLSVAQLAQMFEVSRTPVREALLELARDGLLQPERNRGFRVVGHTARQLDEIYELRVLLETHALAKAAATAPRAPDVIARARKVHAQVERALRAGDPLRFQQLDRELHLLLVDMAGNSLLTSLVSSLRDHLRLPDLATLERQGQMRPALQDHVAIVEAVASGDAKRVATLVRTHLARVRAQVDDSPQAVGARRPRRAGTGRTTPRRLRPARQATGR